MTIKNSIIVLFVLTITNALAQTNNNGNQTNSFIDSIKTFLNHSNIGSTQQVANDFSQTWATFEQNHKKAIMDHVNLLKKRKLYQSYILKKYLSAINNAVNKGSIDSYQLSQYLNTTKNVLINDSKTDIIKFLDFSNSFFENKSLSIHNSFTVNIQDAEYHFKYINQDAESSKNNESITEVEENEVLSETDYYNETYEEQTFIEENERLTSQNNPIFNPSELKMKGPIISFTKLTMNFVTPYDSVFIKNTSGEIMILSDNFYGKKGIFDWSMAGLSPDSVYAVFNNYEFNMNNPSILAEDAKLHYKGTLKNAALGRFEYKSVKHDTTMDASYPFFISYEANHILTNLSPNFKYKGGITLKGSQISSTSISNLPTTISVTDSQSKRFKAISTNFIIKDSIIFTNKAKISIYQSVDSIYHPVVQLKYYLNNKNLVIQKDSDNFKNTPFFSSFYQLNFTVDIIRWDLNADSLDLSILQARNIVPAKFESYGHYNEEDFRKIGQIYTFNPLSLVGYYSAKHREKSFTIEQLANYSKIDYHLIEGAMTELMEKGMVDMSNNIVTIREKATNVYLSKIGKKDYDDIIILSTIDNKPNATLNFLNNEMTVRGVKGFKLSDSLDIIIKPKNEEITILKNRNLFFDGNVESGYFEYIGKEFRFDYDSFLINLNQIDSIRFYVESEHQSGRKGKRTVDNSLVSIDNASTSTNDSIKNKTYSSTNSDIGTENSSSGRLYINKPDNKSSLVNIPTYPRFVSKKSNVVYFDRKDILNGAYDKSVYFIVPPFDLDSLSNSQSSAISFDGNFYSSGIFPSFEERLTIGDDYSLSFEHLVPIDGYQLYEGEGKFHNRLTLNKNGITGNGQLDFLTSSMESNNFIFYPDSVTTQGKYFNMKKDTYNGVDFPSISATDYDLKWLPKKDSMYIKNTTTPFNLYDNTASLNGNIAISNIGVFGSGKLETRGSISESKEMTLNQNGFDAKHTSFDLRSNNPNKPALHGEDVKINFDFKNDIAVISPEVEGEAAIRFPYAQFNTSITEAIWDLNKEEITMSKPDEVPLSSSYFYSTRENLDSLSFMATEAKYDIVSLELRIKGIPYIKVADARITPENNEVLILENAKIGKLINTTIILDTLNGYHRLTDGVIEIVSRNEFNGYATYQFIDGKNETIPIKMENFRIEKTPLSELKKRNYPTKTERTVSDGVVLEDDELLISKGIYYKGKVTLVADQPKMQLDGFIKLNFKNEEEDIWIKHSSPADEQQVIIDYNNIRSEDGRAIDSGLFFSNDDDSIYGIFVGKMNSPDDETFFKPSGYLFYDEDEQEFAIENMAKTSGSDLEGQIFRYNNNTNKIKFEGKVNFLENSKNFSLMSSVIGSGDLNNNEFKMNSMMAINFDFVPNQLFEIMAQDITNVIKLLGSDPGLGDPSTIIYKLADLSGESVARKYQELSVESYTPIAGLSQTTSTSLVFSDLNLKWSSNDHAFYSEGKLGLSNILDNDINAAVEGYMEIKKTTDGIPIFNLFIKLTKNTWYYFAFEDNQLLTHSSNKDYNLEISKKSNSRKSKIGDFVFASSDDNETLAYINRFRLQYLGIKDDYYFDTEMEDVEIQEDEDEDEDDDDGF